MYTGLLDVLHDAADVDLLPIRDRVHVDLGVVLHKLVDEGWVSWPRSRAGPEVEVEVIVIVDDLHPAPAEDVRWPHDDRIPELARHLPRLLGRRCGPEPGVRDAELSQEPSEPGAVFRKVYGVGRGAEDSHSCLFQLVRQLQGTLAAELQDDAFGFLAPYYLQNMLRGQRLEVKARGGVVVGRDGLRVGVDHDRVVAALHECVTGVDAGVVELDALADAVGAAAEDDDGGVLLAPDLVLLFVGGVVVGRARRELTGAGIDGLVGRRDSESPSDAPNNLHRRPRSSCDGLVGEAEPLELAQLLHAERHGDGALRSHDPGYGSDKERVYGGAFVDVGYVHPGAQGIEDGEDAVRARLVEAAMNILGFHLQRSHGFHQALRKRPTYRHDLANRVHPGSEPGQSSRELLEREAGYLGHHVVKRRLERGRRRTRNVVRNLIEGIPYRKLGRYLRYRKPRSLASQRARAAHLWVHLDHIVPVTLGVDRKLDVGSPRGNPYLTYYA